MHTQGGRLPSCRAVIDLHRVKGAVRVAGDVADHPQGTLCLRSIGADEGGSVWPCEDAIEEVGMIKDLRERPAMGGLCYVPAGDGDAQSRAKIARPTAHPAQGPDDQRAVAARVDLGEFFGQCGFQGFGVSVGRNRPASLPAQLRDAAFDRGGCPGETRPIAKGGNAAAIDIGQILQIQQGAATGLEPLQQFAARGLALVGVAEHDVGMRQGRLVFGQLLQTKDHGIARGVGPAMGGDDLAARLRIGGDGDHPAVAVFDAHLHAGCDQRGGPFGRQPGAGLIVALFGAQPKMGHAKIPFARTALTLARYSMRAAKASSRG